MLFLCACYLLVKFGMGYMAASEMGGVGLECNVHCKHIRIRIRNTLLTPGGKSG